MISAFLPALVFGGGTAVVLPPAGLGGRGLPAGGRGASGFGGILSRGGRIRISSTRPDGCDILPFRV